jgi:hypothetical protein
MAGQKKTKEKPRKKKKKPLVQRMVSNAPGWVEGVIIRT